MKPLKSANGVRGCLIRGTGDSPSFLRVGDENGEFRDYFVTHYDVDVIIDDKSAHFYEHDGEFYLDYSPDALAPWVPSELVPSDDDLSVYDSERLVSKYDKGASE